MFQFFFNNTILIPAAGLYTNYPYGLKFIHTADGIILYVGYCFDDSDDFDYQQERLWLQGIEPKDPPLMGEPVWGKVCTEEEVVRVRERVQKYFQLMNPYLRTSSFSRLCKQLREDMERILGPGIKSEVV